ncbi:fasciclin domain-containing protein [Methanolobus sp.]|jgi:transforming growth factor-beta-induced protein|uniref:fasciclin domain-containing protein n=1 Tax=Methanolobus sp. TaxID=1874737 RepID=UPI0025FB5246|nr:fasciclin domain-containing protein [Methanolobus sp.]
MKLFKILVCLLIATTLLISGCAEQKPEEDMVNEEMDIVETAVAAGSFNTLVTALQATGLDETLIGEGPFTVFAPTDEAFEALPEGTLEALLNDKEALTAILTYHVVEGEVMSTNLSDMMALKTVQGEEIIVHITDGNVMVDDANVVQADIEASNGVIHAIDKVILPPSMMEEEEMDIVETAVAAGSFNTLVTALQATGLDETLSGEGPFTVFAPTDEAFEALPEGTLEGLLEDKEALTSVLTYHVVAGEAMSGDLSDMMALKTVQGEEVVIYITDGNVMVNDANVVQADIETSNGVIHVIDKVILPPSMTKE